MKEKNKFLKTRIINSKEYIIEYVAEFEEKIKNNSVHELREHSMVGEYVDKDEMVRLYEQKFVGGNGRDYYDMLMAAAPRGICPLCNKRISNTLDHYLPKTKFPTLAVTPINLVPACSECNKTKTAGIIDRPENQPIHPYFDVIDNEEWLFARIHEDNNIFVEFYVNKPDSWNQLLFNRVCNHMLRYDLYSLYSQCAALKIADMKGFLKNMIQCGGKEGVEGILKSLKTSHQSICQNSWEIALYREMYSNNWFLNTYVLN